MTALMISTMVLCFALTVSVAVSIGLASIFGIQASNANMLISVKEMFSSINKFPLAAIPFFILAGNLMETGGISRRLVEFAKSIVGGVQGGLPMTCVLTCMIFAAVSGSSVATTFAIGAILIPALIKHGYPTAYAAALQATSAELGVIIPPSIPMILYGVSAEVSIGELFIAGFGPGLLIGFALMLFVHLYCRWKGWGKQDGDGRLSFGKATWQAGWALLMPVIILGGIYGGDFHADRGLGGGGVLRAGRRHRDLPRDQAGGPVRHPAQVGDFQRGDHVHHRQRRAVRLPDHPGRRAGRHRPLAAGGAEVACPLFAGRQRGAVHHRHVHRDQRRHHRTGAHPGAGGGALRHRPGALRAGDGGQPRARHDHAAFRREPVRGLHRRQDIAGPHRDPPAALCSWSSWFA
jgi:hypothetical protein